MQQMLLVVLCAGVLGASVSGAASWRGLGSLAGRRGLGAGRAAQLQFRPVSLSHTRLRSSAAPDDQNNRPPIIPFDDFAREDIPMPKAVSVMDRQGASNKPPTAAATGAKSTVVVNPTGWIEDPSRPTGYGRPDLDDNEEEMRQKMLEDGYLQPAAEDEGPFQRWFRDTYIDSPYDSRKKKQARYVIRNITGISFAIGFVFAAIWVAFPGKFISVRGSDADRFTERYASDFVAPEGLLSDEWSKSKVSGDQQGRFFDDAVGLPVQEQTRFPYDAPSDGGGMFRAPPPRADL